MIINLTPHPIVIFPGDTPEGWYEATKIWIDQNCKIIPKSSEYVPARLSEIELGSYKIDDVWIERVQYGQLLTEQPPQVAGTYYIVSLVTALAINRSDFLVPYREIRNLDGTVIGCRSLARPS
jgi:hypothetical protein